MPTKKAPETPAVAVPQSLQEVNDLIRQIGEADHALKRIGAEANEQLEKLRDTFVTQALPYTLVRERLWEQVAAYATAHKDELTVGARSRKLPAGVLGWRKGKKAVEIEDEERAIAALRALKLGHFVRVKADFDGMLLDRLEELELTGDMQISLEPNRVEMLKAEATVNSVVGVKIGQPDVFYIKPNESTVELTAAEVRKKVAMAVSAKSSSKKSAKKSA